MGVIDIKWTLLLSAIISVSITYSLIEHNPVPLLLIIISIYLIVSIEVAHLPKDIFKDYLPITKMFLVAGFFSMIVIPVIAFFIGIYYYFIG